MRGKTLVMGSMTQKAWQRLVAAVSSLLLLFPVQHPHTHTHTSLAININLGEEEPDRRRESGESSWKMHQRGDRHTEVSGFINKQCKKPDGLRDTVLPAPPTPRRSVPFGSSLSQTLKSLSLTHLKSPFQTSNTRSSRGFVEPEVFQCIQTGAVGTW